MPLISYITLIAITIIAILGGILKGRQLKMIGQRKENALLTNFKELIQNLKSKGKTEKEIVGSRSLSFTIRTGTELNSFVLTVVDGRLSVVWKLESSTHGRRGKEWSFDSNYDQKRMFDEIESDLKLYQKALLREVY